MAVLITLFLFALTAHLPTSVAAYQERHHSLSALEKPVIYFDFGGVVAQPDSQIQLNYLVETLGFPEESLCDSPYLCWMQLHAMEIEYLKQKSEEYQIPLTDDDLIRYSEVKRNSVREIPGIRELVMRLQALNYEVNLVTNIRSENFDLVEPFRPLFNNVIHCPKDPGERQEVWEKEWGSYHMNPGQFLLIDDQELNVHEADALGMQAIQFENVDSLVEKLIELGLLVVHLEGEVSDALAAVQT